MAPSPFDITSGAVHPMDCRRSEVPIVLQSKTRSGSTAIRRHNYRRIRSRMSVICTNSVGVGPHMAPDRSLGVYQTMVGQLVLFRTLNGHVSGSHSSTPVSGIWTIITTHSTVSGGIVAFKDTSSHPIHGGKRPQPPRHHDPLNRRITDIILRSMYPPDYGSARPQHTVVGACGPQWGYAAVPEHPHTPRGT